MTALPDLIIKGRRVVLPAGIMPAAVVVRNGRIEEVLTDGADLPALDIYDAGERLLMAGLIDSHVHINEPGRTSWEGFASATRAAAAGGVTMLADMPLNSDPVTTTVDALNRKIEAARPQLHVDCGFYGGIIPGNGGDVDPLIEAGVLGFKVFLIDSGIDEFPPVTRNDLTHVMDALVRAKIPLLVHAEIGSQVSVSGAADSYRTYLGSRPRSWEYEAIRLMVELCHEFGVSTHIVHLSSADPLPLIAKGRRNGWPFTVETCPHYLYFGAEDIASGQTQFKCAPPIRERENADRLWAGLQQGTIDFIVSDHSPCLPELKALEGGSFEAAWGGISSLQLSLAITWTEASRRGFSPMDISRWMSLGPARLLGLEDVKGKIAPGHDADLIVWDPDEELTVTEQMLLHRHKLTPYIGHTLQGVVHTTFLRGRVIFEDGEIVGSPSGRVQLRRWNGSDGGG
ncbi:MAG: allantoinase AllB [Candidatus Marinimicrobia bacterium]|nr:allantoinase AllB [Candidatus Neomarinimicrobiota bacterium]